MSEQIEKDKIYNCDCLEDEVSPDNTGETTDGKGKEAKQKLNKIKQKYGNRKNQSSGSEV